MMDSDFLKTSIMSDAAEMMNNDLIKEANNVINAPSKL